MQEKVERYLRDEKQVESAIVREKLWQKVSKYEDILQEFLRWLEVREYAEDGVEVEGYRAREIYEMAAKMDGIGVFNFLVTLRDEPEVARGIIEEGFIEK